MTPEAVDLSAFIGGPVLNSHERFDVRSILGVVEAASVDGQRGVATIRFSERAEAAAVARDVQDGIVRHVSVGYTVGEKAYRARRAGVRTIIATRWKPAELSFRRSPSGPGGKVRTGANMELHEQIRQ